MNFKISKVLAKDLLQEGSKYIKDGQLIFNKISMVSSATSKHIVNLYYDTYHLASIEIDSCLGSYATFDFLLTDGSMKLHFDDDGICDSPDPYKGIKDATAVLLKEIEAWKK